MNSETPDDEMSAIEAALADAEELWAYDDLEWVKKYLEKHPVAKEQYGEIHETYHELPDGTHMRVSDPERHPESTLAGERAFWFRYGRWVGFQKMKEFLEHEQE